MLAKQEMKSMLFAEDIIICTENSRDFTHNQYQLRKEFSKFADYSQGKKLLYEYTPITVRN